MEINSGAKMLVRTIGHSNRSIEEFIGLLESYGISMVVDVRTIPRSRHNPQFNRDTLPEALGAAGIKYLHFPGLGGLRRARHDSVNTAWRNESFRGYADYMQTSDFDQSLDQIIDLAKRERIALMCAEAVPWRCHRSLIADALEVRGIKVEEIIGQAKSKMHALTPWAKVDGTHITYPA